MSAPILFPPHPGKRIVVLYDDYPWEYKNRHPVRKDGKKSRFGIGAAGRYRVMSPADLLHFSKEYVAPVIAPDAFNFSWASVPQIPLALACMEAKGFRFVNFAFVWVKTLESLISIQQTCERIIECCKINDLSGAMYWIAKLMYFGTGHYTKGNVEVCLLGVKGSPLKYKRTDHISQIVTWPVMKTPKFKHSQKPDIFRVKIQSFCGPATEVPSLEMFARTVGHGWRAFGNEINGRDIHHEMLQLRKEIEITEAAR